MLCSRRCRGGTTRRRRRAARSTGGRDGVVLGEGGGVFVLEELEHARRRGARIYAEVVGFGAAFDRGLHRRRPGRAVRAALAEAGVGPDDLDHVNAQGYSTP